MTSASRATEVLKATGIAQPGLSDESSGKQSQEHIEVAIRNNTKPDIDDDAEDADTPEKDGGARAWLQVVGSFLVFSNIWGITLAFGAFESYYLLTYLPESSSSALSWIGTTANFLLIFGGILTGPLFDMGYFRTMLFTGALIETLAVFFLSLSTNYWQVLITQGIMLGIGDCFLYMPGLALVGRSFKKHRAAALACATCGAPIGAIIFTLVFQQLIDSLGFAWTVRVIGFIILGCYLVSFPLLLWGVENIGDLSTGHTRRLFDGRAFLELPYVVYTASNFMVFFGYLVPFIYMSSFGQTVLGMSSSAANATIMVLQGTSIAGRLAAGWLAAKIGNITQWAFCAIVSGALCLAWIGVKDSGAFFGIVALFGFFSAPLISLPPSAFILVCSDTKVIGTRLGMASAIGAFASLIGSPIAGALEDVGGSTSYLGVQLWSGICMMIGGCLLIVLWVIVVRRKGGSKLV